MNTTRFFLGLAVLILAIAIPRSSSAQTLCATGTVCVTTWQNDNYRTGQNLSESTITYQTIATNDFGQLCSVPLDGQVYAQPLVVTGVQFQGGPARTVVYVVTQNDSIYAIDGTTCEVLNGGVPVSLLVNNFAGQPTMAAASCDDVGGGGCFTIAPVVGILGTPVIAIDTTNNVGTLYVVAETESGVEGALTFYHFLHALDITTLAEGVGNEKSGAPVQVCNLTCGSYSSSAFSQTHLQRPGLLLANCGASCGNQNYVYLSFSMMDGNGYPYPNGAIFGYNTSNLTAPPLYYQTSKGGVRVSNGGGIWMGGAAPAYGPDANGKNWIYVTTANGTFDLNTGGANAGDSFLKLDPATLTMPPTDGYFTPMDQYYRSTKSCINGGPSAGDYDFGSGGVTLIPDHSLAGPGLGMLAVTSDKELAIWFMDRTSPMPHGFDNSCASQCNCSRLTNNPSGNVQTFRSSPSISWSRLFFHSNAAFWANHSTGTSFIALAATGDQLIEYPLCGSATDTHPICHGLGPGSTFANGKAINFPYGVTPSISASDPQTASDALVWALAVEGSPSGAPMGTTPGKLFAFDANTMLDLYTSETCAVDQIAPVTKFSLPTVANGFVYVGAEQLSAGVNNGTGTFYIFGPGRAGCNLSKSPRANIKSAPNKSGKK